MQIGNCHVKLTRDNEKPVRATGCCDGSDNDSAVGLYSVCTVWVKKYPRPPPKKRRSCFWYFHLW